MKKIIVISDLHVGNQFVNSNDLFRFLEEIANDQDVKRLILAGDILDLDRHWDLLNSQMILFLEIIKAMPVEIIWIVGNHDWSIEQIAKDKPDLFGKNIRFVNGTYTLLPDAETELALQNSYVIIHGHEADVVFNRAPVFYNVLVKTFGFIESAININIEYYVNKLFLEDLYFAAQENSLYLRYRNLANFVISGHTHRPSLTKDESKGYANCGDWVSNKTYIEINESSSKPLLKYYSKK